jgi:hypothetical protein
MWLISSHWHVVSRGSIASAAELIRTLQATLIGSGGSPGQVPEGSESAAPGPGWIRKCRPMLGRSFTVLTAASST